MDKQLFQYLCQLYGIRAANEAELKAAMAAAQTQIRAMPATLDLKTVDKSARTVKATIATEGRVQIFDYFRWEPVEEVLLMSGCKLDQVRGGKLPLLDTHCRADTDCVLGSAYNLAIEGSNLTAVEQFSAAEEKIWTKVMEGHLDQRSIGYRRTATTYIEAGESATVDGRDWKAGIMPLAIVSEWIPVEDSVCPIGADPSAGARSAIAGGVSPAANTSGTAGQQKEPEMNKYLEALRAAGKATPEVEKMSEATHRALCTEFGLRVADTAPALPPAGQTPEQAVAAEHQRQDSIREAYKPFAAYAQRADCKINEILERAMKTPDVTVEAFRSEITTEVAKVFAQAPMPRIQVGVEDRDHARKAMAAAVLFRAGGDLRSGMTEDEKKQASKYASHTAIDLARACLERDGQATVGLSSMDIASRAAATTDFPAVMSDALNMSLRQADQAGGIDTAWMDFTDISAANDFRDQKIVDVGAFAEFAELAENDAVPEDKMGDGKESVTPVAYGKRITLSQQAIINDNLGLFVTIPQKMQIAYARTISNAAFRKLASNPMLSDGKAVYSDTLGNLIYDANIDLTKPSGCRAAVAAMYQALLKMTTLGADAAHQAALNLVMRTVVVPATHTFSMSSAIKPYNVVSDADALDVSWTGVKSISNAVIENTTVGGADAAKKVYGFADKRIAPTLYGKFIGGAPRLNLMESRQEYDTWGMSWRAVGGFGFNFGSRIGTVALFGFAKPQA